MAIEGAGEQMTPQTAMMLNNQQIKEAMALSAGMMAFVDDAIGDVMQGLRDAGLCEDTVVCFNSDHGDYMGDYNMILKALCNIDPSRRCPLSGLILKPDAQGPQMRFVLRSTLQPPFWIGQGLRPLTAIKVKAFYLPPKARRDRAQRP